MTNKKILTFAAIAIGGYIVYNKFIKKDDVIAPVEGETTSNARGEGRRKKYEKRRKKLCKYCSGKCHKEGCYGVCGCPDPTRAGGKTNSSSGISLRGNSLDNSFSNFTFGGGIRTKLDIREGTNSAMCHCFQGKCKEPINCQKTRNWRGEMVFNCRKCCQANGCYD